MKKVVTSLAVASILGVGAVADTDGVFVGVQGSTGFDYSKTKSTSSSTAEAETTTSATTTTTTYPAWQIGVLGGYKMYFTPKVGLRVYGLLNYKSSGTNTDDGTAVTDTTNSTLALSANADVLFDFVSKKDLDFGVFGGLSLGYASNESDTDSGTGTITTTDNGSGLDFGINLGLRALLAQKHGLELYSRIGLTEAKTTITGGENKYSTPFSMGLRYTFNF